MRITIVSPMGIKKRIEMPEDEPVQELLPILADKFGIKPADPDGNPVPYRLAGTLDGVETQVDPGLSLKGNGVLDDDLLSILYDRDAVKHGFWGVVINPPQYKNSPERESDHEIDKQNELLPRDGSNHKVNQQKKLPPMVDEAYDELKLKIDWRKRSDCARGFVEPTADSLCRIFLSLQTLLEEVSDAIGVPKHDLFLKEFRHPDTLITVCGLKEAITVTRDFLEISPDFMMSILMEPNRERTNTLDLKVKELHLGVLRKVLGEYAQADPDKRKEHAKLSLTFKTKYLRVPLAMDCRLSVVLPEE